MSNIKDSNVVVNTGNVDGNYTINTPINQGKKRFSPEEKRIIEGSIEASLKEHPNGSGILAVTNFVIVLDSSYKIDYADYLKRIHRSCMIDTIQGYRVYKILD